MKMVGTMQARGVMKRSVAPKIWPSRINSEASRRSSAEKKRGGQEKDSKKGEERTGCQPII